MVVNMSDITTNDDGYRTFSVRWPDALVDEVDRRAKADRRPRNQWLEIYVERKFAQDKAIEDSA